VDSDARAAFDAAVRGAVGPDLDQLSAELAEVKRELVAVRLAAGLPAGRVPRAERQEQVAVLRARGLSRKAIARVVRTTPETVRTDVRKLGLPPATRSLGLDGAVRHHAPRDGGVGASG
jgi:DNA-binding NarL/FixJ family response regulator